MDGGLMRTYSLEEVAESLGVHVNTVEVWARAGELRTINVSRNKSKQRVKHRVLQSDLDNFLAGRITNIGKMEPIRRPRRKPITIFV